MLARFVIIFCSFIVLLVAAIVIHQDYRAYQADITQAEAKVNRLSHIMVDHIKSRFTAVDTLLGHAAERYTSDQLTNDNYQTDMGYQLGFWIKETPYIVAMHTTNSDGHVMETATRTEYAHLDWKIRPSISSSFTTLSHNSKAGLQFDHIEEKIDGTTNHYMVLTRPLLNLDGVFDGTISAVIDSRFIADFYHSIMPSTQTSLTLLQHNYPIMNIGYDGDQLHHITQELDLPGTTDFSQPHSYVLPKSASWPLYVYAFYAIPDVPIVAMLAIHEDDVFVTWTSNRMNYIIFLIIVSIFALVIVYFILRLSQQMRKVQESERAAVMASQTKTEFLAKMSHELRTPLNAIIGFSEMLEAGYFGPVNERQKERMRDVHLCGSHLLELINDILGFAKGDAGKLTLHETTVDLHDVVDKSLRMVSHKAKGKNITIVTEIADPLPMMTLDERKICQALINILTNAVKFTDQEGTIKLQIEHTPHTKDVTLTIIDNGIGIAAEDVSKAFSVFGQVHYGNMFEGTGLGLPLSKMLVELHDGQLQLESVLDIGTKVTICLPSSRIVANATPKAPSPLKKSKLVVQNDNVVHMQGTGVQSIL